MRFNFLRLVFLAAITAAVGIKLLFWVYTPLPPSTDVGVAGREGAGPAGRGVIAGTVYDEHGKPAAGRSVRLMRIGDPDTVVEPSAASMRTETGEDGRYRIEALAAGRYVVLAALNDLGTARVFHPNAARVAEASPVTLEDGAERTAIDLRYQPPRMSRVDGIVTREDGQPIRITVDLILARAPEPERVRLTTGADDQGRFSFGDVPADEYWIVAHTQVRGTVSSDDPVVSRPLIAVADLVVDGRAPATVTLVARPAMTVSAQLMFPGVASESLPDSRERSGMVRLAGRDHRSRTLLALIDTPTRSSADGLVTIHGVPAGRYALAGSSSREWRMTSAAFSRQAGPALTLDVEQGIDLEGIQIDFARDARHASK